MSLLPVPGGPADAIEYAGELLERHEAIDNSAPTLMEVTGISQHQMATASGLNDYDYQKLTTLTNNESIRINQLESVSQIPIPSEVMEHFKNIKCHCMMGLFPEIDRAWLTIDSDIYIWTYENARDVAYFDGLSHLILSVGLVKPKPNVFIDDVKYLLIITTPIEIVVLGVVFADSSGSALNNNHQALVQPSRLEERHGLGEMQLMDKPIFVINTDNVAITTITGTDDYRILLGARDGSLYEIQYQAESNWFGKRCKKINHSQSIISYIVPGFLKVFAEVDSLSKLVVDNSRKLLYTLSEKGAIEAWDLGADSGATRLITRIHANDIVQLASNVLKTVDASIFKLVIALCPLTIKDSPHLHLLAITQCGVRLYFSATSGFSNNKHPVSQQQQQQQPPQQQQTPQQQTQQQVASSPTPFNRLTPHGLYLLHVRLPPGYTSNVSVVKPKSVHSAFYKQGTLLMVSTPQPDQDLLWSLSSEPFPMYPYLAESSTVIPLNGQVWSVAEVRNSHSRLDTETHLVNPMSVAKMNRKVVLLTNQGAHIVSMVKPVYMLQQLLIACHGPHHDSVKAYFKSQSEKEACAVSVLLACMTTFRGTDIGHWATQAFVLYGGEAYYVQSKNFSSSFNDSQRNQVYMSTPFGGAHPSAVAQQGILQHSQYPLSPISALQQSQYVQQSASQPPQQHSPSDRSAGSGLRYSFKHDGLYLYVSRLIGPIWKTRCLTNNSRSSVTFTDCAEILDELYAVRDFIELLPMNNATSFLQSFDGANESTVVNQQYGHSASFAAGRTGNNNQTNTLTNPDQASIEEKKSIAALSAFIKHSCEVLSLWKILCEHQFNILVQTLPAEDQKILSQCSFRDLILVRTDTCAKLIVSLINTYLKDNASVGSISEKLRDVCPNLYRHEDAVSNKATEILMTARTCLDAEEQKDKMMSALQLCKDAAPHLPLSMICHQFKAANFHQGVIELCATCADKIDPNGAALHYYKSNEPLEDQEGYVAFTGRMRYYQEITLLLDNLHQIMAQHDPATNKGHKATSNNNIMMLVNMTLQMSDQLLHNTVYQWLLAHNRFSELLNISEPSLGEFLTHSFARNPDNLQLADILWKYHERNGQHPAATHILDQLASMPSNSITLGQRIEYLARAVMCMRCDSVGYSAHNGILLKNLEDKLEISRVQKLILDALESLDTTNSREAVQHINYTLFNITQLYTEFAEPFELWECKLTILNCSHHNDPLLIESVWSQILRLQLEQPGSAYEKSMRLISKVQTLAKDFANTSHCFPVPFLAHELELRCCQLRLPQSPVPDALIAMNLDLDQLLDVYGRMISMNERIWATAGNEWHLVLSTTRLVSVIVNEPSLVGQRNRRRLVSKAQDLTSACRNLLYPKPDTQSLIDALIAIETKLERM